ncbi:MAG: FMN-binding protein [Pseudomonadota bacterium]
MPVAVLAAPAQGAGFMSLAQTQSLLFPGAKSFVEQRLNLSEEQRDRIKAMSGVRQRSAQLKFWRAERDGMLLGWFIADEVIGKHEFISYAAGIGIDGKVIGIDILDYRETHGGQVREAAWRKHFAGKSLSDAFKLDDDVPNISGATLSCRNLLDGVKRLLVVHKLYLAHG